MEEHLWNKAVVYTQALQQTLTNWREAGVLYQSCFLPALSYPLPAVWLPDKFYNKIHWLLTTTILNKLGYLPRCMVFTPCLVGGISLCHLAHEMETQQLIMLLCHLRAQTQLGRTMEILICKYHLWAGLENSVLQDVSPSPWVPDKWLSCIRHTMHKHNIGITYNAWTILPMRKHDIYLMELFAEGMMQKQLVQLNACCMYLHVTTVAEITDHTGTHILPQAISQKPQIIPIGLYPISISLLEWLQIHCPTKPCWRLWMKMICNLLTRSPSNTTLNNPLGHWMPAHMAVRFW